jgi:hypothetical protein
MGADDCPRITPAKIPLMIGVAEGGVHFFERISRTQPQNISTGHRVHGGLFEVMREACATSRREFAF